RFYFGGNGTTGFKDLLEADIDIRAICTIPLGLGADGVPIEIRIGRYGPFLEHGETRTNIDPELAPADLNLKMAIELIEHGAQFPKTLGQHPDTGQPVLLKKGRYGVYFQLGDDENKEKQKSLMPGMSAEEATLEMALQTLALPKDLGAHPETGEPVLADLGRYGPYVKSGRSNKSLTADDDLLTISLDRAVELLATKSSRGTTELRMLGEHPQSKADIIIKSGRYGPYLTDGTTNVSLKQGEDPDGITLESAVERLAEKAARGPVKRGRKATKGRKKTTARKRK
ncbi:MAG: DNA topoisomerase I, partial [Candidatus Marinimicrobia bacterium]|nr:DNA topoisomerase I [Candidatus Neomarinimicrobiota bacterium]